MRWNQILLAMLVVGCKGDQGFIEYDNPPSVSITDPADGTSIDEGTLVTFGAAVSDDQPGVMLTWSSDLDGELNSETTDESAVTFSIASLTPGLHTITLVGVDSEAQSAEDSMSIEVLDVAEEPQIAVVHPASGEGGSEGTPFIFQAQVLDAQDDSIAMRVSVSSDADGVLCAEVVPDLVGVASCSYSLTAGNHTITFVVTDTDALTATATAAFVVTSGADIDNDGDGFNENQGDCDDGNPAVNPLATEIYNFIDDDCDGLIDNGTQGYDDDGDGFTELTGDCDDTDALINPNATEFGDGIDNDCNGHIDDGTDTFDDDGDGFSEATGDCNDNNININPLAVDVPYNGIDEDCHDGDLNDVDGDGYVIDLVTGGDDCDDDDADINPGAPEVPYNGEDEDCDGDDLTDVDGDGFDSTEVTNGTDCDDLDEHINPDAADIPYNGHDEDCSGTDLTDVDGDGQTPVSIGGSDCNDNDHTIFANATEIPYDGIDQDCAGGDLTDVDGDGYHGGPDGDDCEDTNADVNPGELEIAYNNVDDDCVGGDLRDVDGDGFDSTVVGGTDCDDGNNQIHPNATEIPYNNIDEDCFAGDLVDVDGDGFPAQSAGGQDCDDGNSAVHPNALETCDGADNNCANGTDEIGAAGCTTHFVDADGDGYGAGSGACTCGTDSPYVVTSSNDCYDSNADARPGQTSYFYVHRGDFSFDYNCSGGSELTYSSTSIGDCDSGFFSCDTTTGWDIARPSCGNGDYWLLACGTSAGFCDDSLFDSHTWEWREQRCR